MNNTEHFQAEAISKTNNIFSIIDNIKDPNLQKKLLDRISALAGLAATTVRGGFEGILSEINQIEIDAYYSVYEQREDSGISDTPSYACHHIATEGDNNYGMGRK